MGDGPVGARKDAIVLVYSVVPDACYMPNKSIAFFDLIAIGTDAAKESPDVCLNGKGAIKLDTQLLQCYGDESAESGVFSGTTRNVVDMLPNSCTVFADKEKIVRDGDTAEMNNKNKAIGIVKIVEVAADGAEGYAKGVNAWSDADADAAEKQQKASRVKNQRPKNRRPTSRPKAKRLEKIGAASESLYKRRLAAAQEALAKAGRMKLPGAKGLSKVARGLPGIGDVVTVGRIGGAVLNDDLNSAGKIATGDLAGKAAGGGVLLGCAALGILGGWPGVACLVGAVGTDALVSDVVENNVFLTPEEIAEREAREAAEQAKRDAILNSGVKPQPLPSPTSSPTSSATPAPASAAPSAPSMPSATPPANPMPSPSTPVTQHSTSGSTPTVPSPQPGPIPTQAPGSCTN